MKYRTTWVQSGDEVVPGYFDESRQLHEGTPPESSEPAPDPDPEGED